MKEVYVGVDIGGTKVSVGVVVDNNIVGEPDKFYISDCINADDLVIHIKNSIDSLLKANDINWDEVEHIGVGSPGPLDHKTGVVLKTPNLTMIRYYPLADKLKEVTGIRTFVNNDANCFALGEQKAGAGKGLDYVLGITLGTGFGLGFAYKGEIFSGATSTALEFALTPYKDGVFEDYISGRGISKIYKNITGNEINPKKIDELAGRGDEFALRTWSEFGEHLANALIILVNVLDPDIIVIGGSVANGYNYFINPTKEKLYSKIHERPREHLKVKKSSLGESSAIIGAANLP
jgi:glucokinase